MDIDDNFGEEFMWKYFGILQVTGTQIEIRYYQNKTIQKSAIAKNGKSKSFAEQNQPSRVSKI